MAAGQPWSSCITSSPQVKWSVSVMGLTDDSSALSDIYTYYADRTMNAAGIAKIVLLLEIARRIEAGTVTSSETRSRASIPKLGALGLWQRFETSRLPINDIALLVASTGDNLGTNVMIKEVGVEAVNSLAHNLGLDSIRLRDAERNVPDAGDVMTLFEGSSQDFVLLFNALHHGRLLSSGCAMALNWLSSGFNTSLVSDSFGVAPTARWRLANSAGIISGACAEAGILATAHRTIAYSAIANWDYIDDEAEMTTNATVVSDMRRLGAKLFSVANINPRKVEAAVAV